MSNSLAKESNIIPQSLRDLFFNYEEILEDQNLYRIPRYHPTGPDNWNYGKHPSLKTRLKMSKHTHIDLCDYHIVRFRSLWHWLYGTKPDIFGRSNPGWRPGMYGKRHSDESKKKISEKTTGEKNPSYGKRVSEIIRKKISEAHKGKHLSEEHRRKLGERSRGRHHSEESKRKISESKRGEKHYLFHKHPSEETRRKMSETRKGQRLGEKNPMFGKHHSEETKRKMSNAQKLRGSEIK